MKIMQEFKTFAVRGNVVDMAVGIIMGGAFNKIATSLVNDVLMPPIGKLLGDVDFSNLFVTLGPGDFKTVADAKAAGVATLNYGLFINTVVSFLITAVAVFALVKIINALREKEAAQPPPPAPEVALLTEIRDVLRQRTQP